MKVGFPNLLFPSLSTVLFESEALAQYLSLPSVIMESPGEVQVSSVEVDLDPGNTGANFSHCFALLTDLQ